MAKLDMKALLAGAKGVKQELEMKGGGRRQATAKFKPGDNRVRILPPWNKERREDPAQYHNGLSHSFGQHFIKDATGKVQAVYVCVAKTYGHDCPICEAIGVGIANATSEAQKTQLEQASSGGGRTLVNALMREGDSPNDPQILEMPPSVYEKIMDRAVRMLEEEGEDVFDLDSGFDVIVTKTGTGLSTKYDVDIARKPSSVNPNVLDKLHDIDKYVAQEYDEGRNKALAAISRVSGALPAPVAKKKDSVLDFDDDVPFDHERVVSPAVAPAIDLDNLDDLGDLDL